MLHFGGQLEALALVLDENHHGVVGFEDVARVLVGQRQHVRQQSAAGLDEPLLGSGQVEDALAGQPDAVQFAQVLDVGLAADQLRPEHPAGYATLVQLLHRPLVETGQTIVDGQVGKVLQIGHFVIAAQGRNKRVGRSETVRRARVGRLGAGSVAARRFRLKQDRVLVQEEVFRLVLKDIGGLEKIKQPK